MLRFALAIAVVAVPSFALAQCQSAAPAQNQISALDLQLLQRSTPAPFNAAPAQPSNEAIQRAVERAMQDYSMKQHSPASQLSSTIRGAVRQRVNRNVQTTNEAPPRPEGVRECNGTSCELAPLDSVAKVRTTITRASFSSFKNRYSVSDKLVRN